MKTEHRKQYFIWHSKRYYLMADVHVLHFRVQTNRCFFVLSARTILHNYSSPAENQEQGNYYGTTCTETGLFPSFIRWFKPSGDIKYLESILWVITENSFHKVLQKKKSSAIFSSSLKFSLLLWGTQHWSTAVNHFF